MTVDPTRPQPDDLRLRTALFDRITGLPSVTMLFDDLRAMLDHRRAIGLLHVGISNIALAESVYGWQVFDRLVESQALEVQRALGEELPANARLAQTSIHGAEVLVIVPQAPDGGEVDPELLQRTARALEARLQIRLDSEEFASMVPKLIPRVGFALLSEDPFYRFERLVYRAIEDARSRPKRSDDRRRKSWAEALQQLIRDEGIHVCYQPVVALDSFEIVGYEALSRGPAGSGFESPAVMFEISREAGVAADLDRLCRRRALGSARGIPPGRKIFLNARIDNLADPDWQGPLLEQSLAMLELAPSNLVVEIPHHQAHSDETALARWIGGLKQRGFQLAIDDIGTGYAGIQSIETLGPDYLKIDTSLVRRIDSNLIQQDLLGSLVTIGGRIGAEVIAEGIESCAEKDFLRDHGAAYGQGFLFSEAVPELLAGPLKVGSDH